MSNYTVIKPPSLSCTDGAVTCATNSMQANAIRSNNIIREAGGMKGGNKNTNIEFQSAAISNNESSKIAGALGKNITELLNQEIENSKYDKMAGGKRKSKKIKKRKSKNSKKRKISKGGMKKKENVSWKGVERNIYTYNRGHFPTSQQSQQSQDSDVSDMPIILKFNEGEKINGENLESKKLYIFVVELKDNQAVMYLGDQLYNHNDLLDEDEEENIILAAGELIWDHYDVAFKISNRSGHYEPDYEDVKKVIIEFLPDNSTIYFYEITRDHNDASKSPLHLNNIDESTATETYIVEKNNMGGKRKSKKSKRKTRKIKGGQQPPTTISRISKMLSDIFAAIAKASDTPTETSSVQQTPDAKTPVETPVETPFETPVVTPVENQETSDKNPETTDGTHNNQEGGKQKKKSIKNKPKFKRRKTQKK